MQIWLPTSWWPWPSVSRFQRRITMSSESFALFAARIDIHTVFLCLDRRTWNAPERNVIFLVTCTGRCLKYCESTSVGSGRKRGSPKCGVLRILEDGCTVDLATVAIMSVLAISESVSSVFSTLMSGRLPPPPPTLKSSVGRKTFAKSAARTLSPPGLHPHGELAGTWRLDPPRNTVLRFSAKPARIGRKELRQRDHQGRGRHNGSASQKEERARERRPSRASKTTGEDSERAQITKILRSQFLRLHPCRRGESALCQDLAINLNGFLRAWAAIVRDGLIAALDGAIMQFSFDGVFEPNAIGLIVVEPRSTVHNVLVNAPRSPVYVLFSSAYPATWKSS